MDTIFFCYLQSFLAGCRGPKHIMIGWLHGGSAIECIVVGGFDEEEMNN